MAVIAERLIQGAGTPESAWQAWLESADFAPREALTGWSAQMRLVVLAPHPDDELLACGGWLARHAAQGGECLVVAVTDGEASHAGSAGWSAPTLAGVRRTESAEGLRRLGLREGTVARLSLPDGDVAGHTDALAAGLTLLLRPTDWVVSTWRLDGHPDHDATGRTAADVCAAIGCGFAEAPVWMWHWAKPGDPRVPWHRMQGLRVDAQAALRKRAALDAHASQLTARDARTGPVLDAAILARAARGTEYFFV